MTGCPPEVANAAHLEKLKALYGDLPESELQRLAFEAMGKAAAEMEKWAEENLPDEE